MDIKMASATVVSRIDQEAVNPSGGVQGILNTPLVGTGVDSEDQTVAVESPGGKGASTVSTGMEVDTADEKNVSADFAGTEEASPNLYGYPKDFTTYSHQQYHL